MATLSAPIWWFTSISSPLTGLSSVILLMYASFASSLIAQRRVDMAMALMLSGTPSECECVPARRTAVGLELPKRVDGCEIVSQIGSVHSGRQRGAQSVGWAGQAVCDWCQCAERRSLEFDNQPHFFIEVDGVRGDDLVPLGHVVRDDAGSRSSTILQ